MKMLLTLTLLSLTMILSHAAIPIKASDMAGIYGKGTKTDVGRVYTQNEITITTHRSFYDLTSIVYTRAHPFSELEIPALLKPLGAGEEWKKKGNNTWVLEKAKCTAVWDGAGKITVQ